MPFVKIVKEPSARSLRKDEELKVGAVVEMSETDANRWIRRGVGEVVEGPSAKKGVKNESAPDNTGGK